MAMAIPRDRAMGEMNVTPLVDVMLVLLIIFMVTVPAVTRINTLEMPQATPGQAAKAEPVRLFLTAAGTVEWNGEPLSLQQLQSRFQASAQAAGADAMRQPKLELSADGGADYQLLASVLASASNAGLVRIELTRTD